jgi:hypothetical protein
MPLSREWAEGVCTLHYVASCVAHTILAEEWSNPALFARPSHAQRQASSPWRPDNGPDCMRQTRSSARSQNESGAFIILRAVLR